jgi:hypothetical protein
VPGRGQVSATAADDDADTSANRYLGIDPRPPIVEALAVGNLFPEARIGRGTRFTRAAPVAIAVALPPNG